MLPFGTVIIGDLVDAVDRQFPPHPPQPCDPDAGVFKLGPRDPKAREAEDARREARYQGRTLPSNLDDFDPGFPRTCPVCHNLCLEDFASQNENTPEHENYPYELHMPARRAIIQASRGCECCRIFHEAVKHVWPSNQDSPVLIKVPWAKRSRQQV